MLGRLPLGRLPLERLALGRLLLWEDCHWEDCHCGKIATGKIGTGKIATVGKLPLWEDMAAKFENLEKTGYYVINLFKRGFLINELISTVFFFHNIQRPVKFLFKFCSS